MLKAPDKFPCSGCGICCRHVGEMVKVARQVQGQGISKPYVDEVAAFPYEFDKSGRCSQLSEDNRCLVYEGRPDVCNIETMWRKYSRDVPRAVHFFKSAQLCNSLIIDAGAPDRFLISIPDKL